MRALTLRNALVGTLSVLGVVAAALTASLAPAEKPAASTLLTPTTVTFQQGASGYGGAVDTYVDDGVPDTSQATATTLSTDLAPTVQQSLVRFGGIFASQGGPVPDGANVLSASLTISVPTSPSDSATNAVVEFHRMNRTWGAAETWNTFGASPWNSTPGVQADGVEAEYSADTSRAGVPQGVQTIDVTASLRTWSAVPASNFGWAIMVTSDDKLVFESSDATVVANRPKLSVTYETCVTSADCDDANPCTTDACGGGTCSHTARTCPAGQTCDPASGRCQGPPDQPTNPSPSDGATGVSTTPLLCVDVHDADGDDLSVTFKGRPAGGPPPSDFTIVALPDPQFYAQTYPDLYNAQLQWCADNRVARDIVFVTGLGDMTNNGDSQPGEWNNVQTAFSIIENVAGLTDGMPYGFCLGNHDNTSSARTGTDEGATTVQYNSRFGTHRFQSRGYFGGHYDFGNPSLYADNMDNHYELFSGGGMDFIIFHLEYDAADNATRQGVLAWMDNLLTNVHPSRRAIVIEHNMIAATGTPPAFTSYGQAIYDTVKDDPNVFLAMTGHATQATRRSDTYTAPGCCPTGHTIDTLLSDYQDRPYGGRGWLRVLTFSPQNDTIHVETLSPWVNYPGTPKQEGLINGHVDNIAGTAQNDFVLSYDMPSGAPFATIGTAGVSGGTGRACVRWNPGLQPGQVYEWRVEIADGTNTTTGPAYTFTPAACATVADCNDSDACTTDACTAGICSHTALSCADSDPCTVDTCSGGVCQHTPIVCNDQNACTGPDTCVAGVCQSPYDPSAGCCTGNEDCNDGNAATQDVCTAGDCTNPPAPTCASSLNCNDSDACTTDVCLGSNADALHLDGVDDQVSMGAAAGLNASPAFTLEAWINGVGGTAVTNGTGTGGFADDVAIPLVTKGRSDVDTPAESNMNYFLGIVGGKLAADFEEGAGCTDFAPIGAAAGTATAYNDTTAVPNTAYAYRVRATDAAPNLGPYSNVASATTPAGALLTEAAQAVLATPVAAYSFSAGSGTTLADVSGNGNDGSISGATWTTSGQYGAALSFDGVNDIVTIANAASLQLIAGMTLEAWVYPTEVTNAWRDVVYKGDDNYYLMGMSTNASKPVGGIRVGTSSAEAYGTAALTVNTWAHLAVTYDGAALRFFVNAVEQSSTAKTGNILTSTNPLQLGGDGIYGQYFKGRIDEVRVYNVALTQPQIQTDMNTPLPGEVMDTEPPTAPGSLAATAAGATQINLAWTASTDNRGVTGYSIERCEGGGGTSLGLNHPVCSTADLPPTGWHHVAAAYDGNCWQLYVDGAQQTLTTSCSTCSGDACTTCPGKTLAGASPEPNSAQHFAIGAAQNSTGVSEGRFDGKIDEVRVWNLARTQAQIQAAMGQELSSATGLIGRFGLNEGIGTVAHDSTTPAEDGTISGGAIWDAIDKPGLGPGVCRFTPIDCSDGNPCTVDACGGGSCSHVAGNNGVACNDDNACTLNDVCTNGVCAGSADPTCCSTDADCSDANACTIDFCPVAPNEAAIQCDGVDDVVTMGAAAGLGTATFTLEAWIRWEDGGATANTGTGGFYGYPIVAKGRGEVDNGDNRDTNYFFGIRQSDSVLAADFEEGAGQPNPSLNHPIAGTTVITKNVWHHAAVTYDGSCWALYLDGTPEALNGTMTACPATTPRTDSIQHFAVGSALNSTGVSEGAFKGAIDEVRVWNRALTRTEIVAGMARVLRSGSGLLGRWGLDEGIGLTAADSTTPAENGALTNGPAWITSGLVGFGTTGVCEHDASPNCCQTSQDCGDGNPCTSDTCVSGACQHSPIASCCTSDGQCGDIDICTTDACVNNACTHAPIPSCCTSAEACNDGNACTTDGCNVGSTAALSFNGSSSQVAMGAAPGLGAQAFTLECWMNWTGGGVGTGTGTGGLTSAVPLVTKGRAEQDASSVDMNYFLGIDVSGTAKLLAADFEEGLGVCSGGPTPGASCSYVCSNSGTTACSTDSQCSSGGTCTVSTCGAGGTCVGKAGLNHPVTGTTDLSTLTGWHHVAATYDYSGRGAGTWRLYLDGNLEAQLAVGQPPRADSIQPFAVGTAMTSTGVAAGFFAGSIDEVRVWSRPLSQSELQANKNRMVATGDGLIGRWGFDEGVGTTAYDATGVQENGTIGSGTWLTAGLAPIGTNLCEHTNVSNGTVCEDGSSCTLSETCQSGACVPGAVLTVPAEIANVRHTNKTVMTWNAATGGGSPVYDVVRGLLGQFPSGGSGASESCPGDGISAPTLSDAQTPANGTGVWYLIRAHNACGIGTYGFTAPRSGSPVERRTTTCP